MIILKKFFFISTLNLSFFILLMIGIQNSSVGRKVNLLIFQTVRLPVSFITGLSFISGSITGSLLTINVKEKETLKRY